MRAAMVAVAVIALLGFAAVFAAAPPADGAQEEEEGFKPYVSLWGDRSEITEASFERVVTEEAWGRLWGRHIDDDVFPGGHYNTEGLPDVNFDRCMVLAVFRGEQVNNAGVTVRRIIEREDALHVRFEDHPYQTGIGPPAEDGKPAPDERARKGGEPTPNEPARQHARPYGIFIVPRSKKAVVFERYVHNKAVQEPKLSTVKRLPALDGDRGE